MKMSKEIIRILQQRYFLKDEKTWDDIAKRVSKLYDPIYPYIRDMVFIPSSPTIMNAGTSERTGTLSSCFIMGIEDSIEGIMDSMKEAALVQKMCGGTGFNWSVLRGNNEMVKSTQKNSGGVMSFIGIFDAILNGVIQGSARRGAGMSLLSVNHPDILQFINAKKDRDKYTRSNFSVKIPNKFYEILEKNPDRIFKTVNVVDGKENVLKDNDGNEITYKKLWNVIIENSWGHAEPGIFHSDIASERCTCKHINSDVNCNPCCITGDTEIFTEKGSLSIKEITDKQMIGLNVLSYNTEKNIFKMKPIEKAWLAKKNTDICFMKTTDCRILRCTPDHNIWTERKWIEVDNLKNMTDFGVKSDSVLTVDGYSKVEENYFCKNKKEDVYDLTIKDNHTFIANGIIISNSEYVHIPYTSCNLGSINLSKLIRENKFDWNEFDKLIKISTQFLNKVVDKNKYPIKKIEEETLKARPIGLGCMGLAHLFYRLKIPYNSIEANEIARKIIRKMTLTAMQESVKMAKGKGKAYEYFDYKTFMSANERFWDEDTKELEADIKKYGCYNSSETSIAPTGSISFIANCSGGIEPVFGLVYSRKIEKAHKTYDTVYVVDPVFEEYVDSNLKDKKDKIYKYISGNNGSCQGCDDIPEDMRKVFVVAGDLTPDEHLDMLASVSNVTSLSVAKTVNLPENATKEDISDVYLKAHKKGIIGVTVYRDKCREGILIHDSPNVKLDRPERVERHMAPKRPVDIPCDIYDTKVNGKRFVVIIGFLNESLYEIFVTEDKKEKINLEKYKKGIIRKRKQNIYDLIVIEDEKNEILIENIGDTFDAEDSSLSRLVSMSLRHGVPLEFLCEQLDRSRQFGGFSKAVMRILKRYIKEGTRVIGEKCPECDNELSYMEGCKKCADCGWAHCG